MNRRNLIKTMGSLGVLSSVAGCTDFFYTPDDSPEVSLYGDRELSISGTVSEGSQPHLLIGDADAPYKVHYFTDPQCSFCFRWDNTRLPEVFEKHIQTGEVAMYFRPIGFFNWNRYSDYVSTIAYTLYDKDVTQSQFLRWYTQITTAIQSEDSVDDINMISELRNAGVESDVIQEVRRIPTDGPDIPTDIVEENMSTAQNVGFTGTPFFVFVESDSDLTDDITMTGFQPNSEFDARIDELKS